eukprot:886730_1
MLCITRLPRHTWTMRSVSLNDMEYVCEQSFAYTQQITMTITPTMTRNIPSSNRCNINNSMQIISMPTLTSKKRIRLQSLLKCDAVKLTVLISIVGAGADNNSTLDVVDAM